LKRAVLVLLLFSCTPDFGDRESLVGEPRVLAVVADPPETKPGTASVTFSVLVASRDGTVTTTPPSFAFCAAPKLLTENTPVSAQCLTANGLRPFGGATAQIPTDACTLFGPETPPGGFRPRDPDVTGGYYQPVRVAIGASTAFAFERIQCNLAQAPADAANTFAQGYHPNVNPVLDPLTIDPVARGARVVLRSSWPAASAESYLTFDVPSQAVVTRREALRVSWFATAGAFDNDVTGRAEDDEATFTENAWTAPSDSDHVVLWRVLRDSRGGATWSEHTIVLH
jgi:hypothetical protein